MTLDEIALTTKTDRSSRFHDYMRTYEELFWDWQYKPVRLLEMGILGGDGLSVWDQFFGHPEAEIIGIDIDKHPLPELGSRVRVLYGSQADKAFLNNIQGPFDIIIDDAGHFVSQQIAAFFALWDRLNDGGLYIIEDLHTYASPAHQDGPLNIMKFLTDIAFEMQARGDTAHGKVDSTDKWVSIDTVTFRKGMAILRRACAKN